MADEREALRTLSYLDRFTVVTYWRWLLLHAQLRQAPVLMKIAVITLSLGLSLHTTDHCRDLRLFAVKMLFGYAVAITAAMLLPRRKMNA